jgi:aldose 1-epimerase
MAATADVIQLRDPASGSRAAILPGFGFNCFSFVAVIDGQAIETLWTEPGFGPGIETPPGGGRWRPASEGETPPGRGRWREASEGVLRSGIPLVFPFAGRLGSDQQTFEGQTFTVRDAPVLAGKPLHGYVIDRPWRVVEQTEQRAVATFRAAVDEPSLLAQWPADFEIRMAYEVVDMALIGEVTITNPDSKPLPFGFGTHPYFRVPLSGDDAAACRVTVPAGAYWELSELVPTGRTLPASEAYDLRNARDFGDISIDAVFTDLAVVNGVIETVIEDPISGRRLVQRADPAFRHCTVFCPPHREAIAIEPWTAIPNPLALAERGVDTGLRVLAPGETFSARVEIAVE